MDPLAEIFSAFEAAGANPPSSADRQRVAAVVGTLEADDIEGLLGEFVQRPQWMNQEHCRPLAEFVFARLAQESLESTGGPRQPSANLLSAIESAYRVCEPDSNVRNHLLAWLASLQSVQALETFAQLIVEDPPRYARGIVVAFQPLFREQHHAAAAVFPQLLEAIQHVDLAAAVLDLANHLTRQSVVSQHPAGDRQAALGEMIRSLTYQLKRVEEGHLPAGADPQELSNQVETSVALLVSLCDALALIGDTSAISKLEEAAELKHRRVQTEAAAALVRLGQDSAKERLLELLDEPVARLRVITYAEELGFLDEIPEHYRSAEKSAESELAIWLAQPSHMGLAPSHVEIVDRRLLYWPGFEDPVECFLLKYQFSSAAGTFENIGISGPLTYVFAADLTHLPRRDQYAAFAGWHALHDDLYEIPYDKACVAFRRDTEARMRAIEDFGCIDISPQFVGMFFDEKILVGRARWGGESGIVIADEREVTWLDPGSETAPICPDLAYCIYKGRRFLEHFNPGRDFDGEEEPSAN